MTPAEIQAALDERDLLERRIRRLNRFLDEPRAHRHARTDEIIREARDLAAQEKLTIELTLSIEMYRGPTAPRPPLGVVR